MLEAGAVVATLGARFDDTGFDRYERRLEHVRAESRRPIEADLGAEVDDRGFDRYEQRLKAAEQQSGEYRTALLAVERAQVAVAVAAERRTTAEQRLADAVKKYGAESEQARRRSLELERAHLSAAGAANALESATHKLTSGFDAAGNVLGGAGGGGGGLTARVGALGGSMGAMAKVAIAATPILVALGGALTALAASATAAVGGLGALGIAAGAAFAPILGLGAQVKNRMESVVDALKKVREAREAEAGAAGDAARNAAKEAMENLSTVERGFVGTLERLDGVRKKVLGPAGDRVFAGMARGIDAVLPTLERLAGPFRRLGGAIGSAFERVGEVLSGREWSGALRSFVEAAGRMIEPLSRAAGAVASILRDVARAAMPFLQRGLERLATFFSELDESATRSKITGVIRTLIGHTSSWLALFKEVGRLIFNVFNAGADDGKGLVDTITKLVGGWADFLGTEEGQAELREFFRDSIKTVKELAKIVGTIGSVGMDAARGFIDAFNKIGPVLRGIGRIAEPVFRFMAGDVEGAYKAIQRNTRTFRAAIHRAFDGIGEGIRSRFLGALSVIVHGAVDAVNTIIGVINKLPGVDIGKVGHPRVGGLRGTANPYDVVGPGVPISKRIDPTGDSQNFFAGGIVNAPIAIVGEEAPEHPEVIIPSNPRYRGRALDLFAHAGRMLGVPGFAKGGVLRRAAGVVGAAGDLARDLIGQLPGNPFSEPFDGFGSYLLDQARDFIRDKARAAARALTGSNLGGIIGGAVGGTLGRAAELVGKFGGLRVTSGYRTPEQNARDNGVPGSLHTHGTPGNPGAFDVVGPMGVMQRALAYARQKWAPREAMIHDVGSGLHLHLGFFAQGGVRGRKQASKIAAAHRRAAQQKAATNRVRSINVTPAQRLKGIAGYEDQLDNLQHDLTIHERQADRSEDAFILEDPDGNPYLNVDGPGGVNERVRELDVEKGIRERIRDKIDEYRRAVDKAIKALRVAIKKLEDAIKGATKPQAESYREALRGYRDRLGELRDTKQRLSRDFDLAVEDIADLDVERAGVAGTTAPGSSAGSSAGAGAADQPDLQAVAAQANARAAAMAQDLAATRATLATFQGAGDIGAGGTNAFAAAAANAPVGAGAYAGAPGAAAGLAAGGAPVQVTVAIHSFVPPTGKQAQEVAGMVTAALSGQPYSQANSGKVG